MGKIPEDWKRAVKQILTKGDVERIQVALRALLEFQALFPGAFSYEMYDAFLNAISDPELTGRQIFGMQPQGETYAFIFMHQREKLYGKICLTSDKRLIVIFSAHRPNKGDEA